MLIGVEIKGFSILSNFKIGWTTEDLKVLLHQGEKHVSKEKLPHALTALTAFIGRNSTGKTTIFECLDFLSDCVLTDIRRASTLKQRLGFQTLKTHDAACPMCLTIHALFPTRSECLTWSLELDQDIHGRPYVTSESVIGHWCPKSILKYLNIYNRGSKSSSPKEPQYEGERIYLSMSSGNGQVLYQNEMVPVRLNHNYKTGLSILGEMGVYPALQALNLYIGGWYYCRYHETSSGQASYVLNDAYMTNQAQLQSAQGGHQHLDDYAKNVSNVLEWLKKQDPDQYRTIIGHIAEYLPCVAHLKRQSIERALTDSERQMFVILLLLNDPDPRPLIMFENPDANMYHEMVDALGLSMRQYVLRQDVSSQLFFSTHNTNMIDPLCPAEVWHFNKIDTVDVIDQIEQIDRQSDRLLQPVRAHCVADLPIVNAMYEGGIGLGAMWYAGHLEPPTSANHKKDEVHP